MSDKPIEVGDLVEVIKPGPCNCCHSLGNRYVVVEIGLTKNAFCLHCGNASPNGEPRAKLNCGGYCGLSRLKRIDPPALPESLEHKESLTA